MQLKKLGLVLSGGGGKGVYQIGVWKALREFGLESEIAAVAGTSRRQQGFPLRASSAIGLHDCVGNQMQTGAMLLLRHGRKLWDG